MDEMKIASTRVNGDTVELNPGKMLDNSNAHEMAMAISEAQSRGYKYIIINMDQLEFISSAGVGSILGSVETMRESDGDIIICNAAETILHVFSVLDLFDYLTIKPDRDEALKTCQVGHQG
nr:anti-sigma factor antagonist [candidate division Zixibacteria bacterium]